MKHRSWKKKLWFAPLIVVGIAAWIYVTMLLWNWLMPFVFHLPVLTFWQVAGVLLLFKLLFGHGGHWKYPHHPRPIFFRDKWEKMSPEEREKFKEQMRSHRRFWDDAHCGKPGHENSPVV